MRIMGKTGRCVAKYTFLILHKVVRIVTTALRNFNIYVFTWETEKIAILNWVRVRIIRI